MAGDAMAVGSSVVATAEDAIVGLTGEAGPDTSGEAVSAGTGLGTAPACSGVVECSAAVTGTAVVSGVAVEPHAAPIRITHMSGATSGVCPPIDRTAGSWQPNQGRQADR